MNIRSNRVRRSGEWACALLFAISWLALPVSVLRAGDHFLTIGGGDSPSYNQVSLEKNVLFFRRLLGELEGPNVANDIFFSDGDAGSNDVQYVAADESPKINLMLARLFNQDDGVAFGYRPHNIPGVRGPSSRVALQNWFNTTGKRLSDGDRLFIYFTGHGGPGNPVRNTNFSLWNDRAMTVWDFTLLLDKLSPKVEVVLIMVQCHAGGFADVIFNGGRVGPRLSDARRSGFFATTPDRNAAGCTADISEDDYRDYSTYFFAALGGKTRTGKPIASPDYDHDGRVSLAEAHAYTLINADTIDVPLTASDVLLRQFVKNRGDGPITADSPLATLLSHASIPQRAALEGLAEKLHLQPGNEIANARRIADRTVSDRKDSEKQRTQRWNEADRLAKAITSRLTRRWPELSSPWNPLVPVLLKDHGSDIQKMIEDDRNYARYQRAYDQYQAATDKDLDLDHQWAKCQRFIYTAESVALAASLEQNGDVEVVAKYKQILADEAGTLVGAAGKPGRR